MYFKKWPPLCQGQNGKKRVRGYGSWVMGNRKKNRIKQEEAGKGLGVIGNGENVSSFLSYSL